MHEVVKKEIIKWLDISVIYPIVASCQVCPLQCVPKKTAMTMVPDNRKQFLPMRTVIRQRFFMDYKKFKSWTQKDHFPMSFMNKILDTLEGKGWYCLLDGYSWLQ